jgi:hypothetical protein
MNTRFRWYINIAGVLGMSLIFFSLIVGWTGSILDARMPPEEYRTMNGTGNNIAHPSWGSAGSRLMRGSSGPHYGDGISSMAGIDRPSPREISNALFDQRIPVFSTVGHSDYIWTWGQFLDHDFGLTPAAGTELAPIAVPPGDRFFPNVQSIAFSRSLFDPATGTTTPREQINLNTAYIDGSNVYGSDDQRASWLRTHVGGRLKVTPSWTGDLLPYNDGTILNAGTPEKPDLSIALFVAGDIRANEQPTLAAIHTLFVREHNYHADRIARENKNLKDEDIYQRARKIVVAEIQNITYEEFVPALLGTGSGRLPPDTGYDPAVNAAISQVFSTAAYRLGHTLLSPLIQHIDANGNVLPPLSLRDIFFGPTPPILANEGIEPILRGLAAQKAQDLDSHIIDDVRNFLFGNQGPALDLIALNLQRGRDHGLPDFNTVREEFGLPRKTSFFQIASPPNAQIMARLYGSVDNIDLFAGLLLEDDQPGMIVGETLRAILVDQFVRSRAGDRMFYTRFLSGAELDQVRKTRLSDVVKRNTTITGIQDNVFFVRGVVNPL